jgi:N-acetyl-anhydromuramyl-L-alanine amidase AmpD
MARARRTRSGSAKNSAGGNRARTVWLSLLGAMTAVGGLLLVLDPKPAPSVGGAGMLALVSTGSVSEMESVFSRVKSIDRARWQAIVIHHTDSSFATPETLTAQHVKAGLKSMGHHFVIGNGRGLADGELHIGQRWLSQQAGAHVAGRDDKAAWFNKHALSICLVGDGDRDPFTQAQLQQMAQLVRSLCDELNIPASRVVLHRDVATTTDPGRLFPEQWLRERLNDTAAR